MTGSWGIFYCYIPFDYPVKVTPFVMQWLATLAYSLFSSTKCAKVLCCHRDEIGVELEDDTPSRFITYGYIKIGVWTFVFWCVGNATVCNLSICGRESIRGLDCAIF
jgi:hypothetical protein